VALVGLEGRIVEVEADIGAGLPRTVLVGLPDSALYQSRDRCKAAVSNSDQDWPISLLTINLSPATRPRLAAITMWRSSQRCLRRRVSSEPKNYAEQYCWASLGWMVASDPSAAFCRPLWRLNRQASPE
jgi:Subunit ChlI of Mg-chelatase